MQVVFDSLETGTLYFNGGSTRIQHFNYGYSSKYTYFYGEWSMTIGIGAGLIEAQWIVFDGRTFTGSDGNTCAVGYLDQLSTSTSALGCLINGQFGVIVSDSVGYETTYIMAAGDAQRMIGNGWLEPSGTSISGSGSVCIANRMLSAGELTLTELSSQPESSKLESMLQSLGHNSVTASVK